MVGAACSADRCDALPPNAPRSRASSLGYAWRNWATASLTSGIMSLYRTISDGITRCRGRMSTAKTELATMEKEVEICMLQSKATFALQQESRFTLTNSSSWIRTLNRTHWSRVLFAPMSLERGAKAIDQSRSGEGLGQEANCARL